MHHDFEDIRSRISEPPSWFDSNGTPRYGEFDPGACPCIYADEVALVEIACQACDQKFMVEIHRSITEHGFGWTLASKVRSLHYGDPPAHDCTGDTMNCLDLRVVEFWRRKHDPMLEWERVAELEVALEDAQEKAE
jgi:hypothetical protein